MSVFAVWRKGERDTAISIGSTDHRDAARRYAEKLFSADPFHDIDVVVSDASGVVFDVSITVVPVPLFEIYHDQRRDP